MTVDSCINAYSYNAEQEFGEITVTDLVSSPSNYMAYVTRRDGTVRWSTVTCSPFGNGLNGAKERVWGGTAGAYGDAATLAAQIVRFEVYEVGPTCSDPVAEPSAGATPVFTLFVGAMNAGDQSGGVNPAGNSAQCACQDPINTATGEFFDAVTDLALPGRMPLAVERTYSSTRAMSVGLFGAGWRSLWDARVSLAPGSATVSQENGTRVTFASATDGTWVAPPDVYATLAADPTTGGYVFVRRSLESFRFDSTGRLTAISDRQGQTASIARSATATTTTLPDGRMLTFSLDSAGRATRLAGPQGRSVSYSYGPAGELTQVMDARGNTWAYSYDPDTLQMTGKQSPFNEVTTIGYNFDGQAVRQTDPLGHVSTLAFSRTVAEGTSQQTDAISSTTLTDPAGRQRIHVYRRGLLQKITVDPQGTNSSTSFTYDSLNNRSGTVQADGASSHATFASGDAYRVTDLGGTTTTVNTNAFHMPTSIYTDPNGGGGNYTYDSYGNMLTSVVYPRSTPAVTTYKRDPARPADVLSMTDPDGKVISMTYTPEGFLASRTTGDGAKTTFTYDAYGAVLQTVAPKGNATGATPGSFTTVNTYDPAGLLLTSKDPLGHLRTLTYDADGRQVTTQDAYSKTTRTAYYADGSVQSRTDPLGHSTSFTYDASGKELSRTDSDGAVTTRTYDTAGRLATLVKPSGNAVGVTAEQRLARTVTYTYDAVGRPTGTSQPDPAAPGQFLTEQTAYDAAGRPWKSTVAGTLTTTTQYDSLGQVSGVTTPDNALTTFAYDNAGHRISTTDPLGKTSKVAYTLGGRVASSSDALENTTRYTYDSVGRQLTTVAPRGTCAGCTAANFTTTLGYDLNGNVLTTKDELGRVTTNTYDGDDRLVSIKNAKNLSTDYGYDAADRLLSVKTPDTGVTSYGYDDAGEQISIKSPRLNITAFAYDAAGRLASTTDPQGRTRSRTYTADGLVSTDVTARGNASASPVNGTIAYTYDAVGRRTAVNYGDGSSPLSYGYDTASRLTSMTDAVGTQNYTYDPNGRTAGISRNGTGWTYTYAADGRVTSSKGPDAATETFTYDDAGRPKTSVTPVGTTTYTYDPASNLLTSALPNGTTETQTWDRAGQLAKIATTRGTTTVVAQTVTRDATDQPSQIVTNRGTASETRSFKYDPNERLQGICYIALTSCTGASAATQWWAYDTDGNRATEKNGSGTGTTTSYTYDNADQLSSSKIGTGVVVSNTYDPDGNQLTDGTTSYAYDLNSRIKSSTSGGATTAWQRDGDGNPVKASSGATTTTTYSWDLNGPIPQLATKTTGTSAERLNYDPLGRPSTLTTGTTKSTIAHDLLGSPTDLVSSAGVLARSADWTPFGKVRTATGAPTSQTGAVSPAGYAGMVAGVGTAYMTRDRQYSPGTGRWTATDPIPMSAGPAFDSPYTYAMNQPGRYTDPLGQWPCDQSFSSVCQSVRFFGGELVGAYDAAGGLAEAVLNPIDSLQTAANNCAAGYNSWNGGAAGIAQCLDGLNPVASIRDSLALAWKGCPEALGSALFQSTLLVAPVTRSPINPSAARPGPASRLVPGGGLAAAEGGEGTVLSRLQARMADDTGSIGLPGGSARLTNSQASDLADWLGYRATKFRAHGQRIFTNGKTFITQDVDAHVGGTWKMANSVDDLLRGNRAGTYDYELNWIAP